MSRSRLLVSLRQKVARPGVEPRGAGALRLGLLWAVAAWLAFWPSVGGAQLGGGDLDLDLLGSGPPVRAEVFAMNGGVVSAGNPTALAVVLEVAEGFHVNPDLDQARPAWFPEQYPTTLRVLPGGGEEPAERAGKPTTAVDEGGGIRWTVQYPPATPYEVAYARQEIPVWEGRVVLYVPLLVRAEVAEGPRRLELELEVQACDAQRCLIPQTLPLVVDLQVTAAGTANAGGVVGGDDAGGGGADGEQASADDRALFADLDPAGWSALAAGGAEGGAGGGGEGDTDGSADASAEGGGGAWDGDAGSLGWTLLVAVAAGLLLNFTPCVLPVVPLKVMSLARHGQQAGGRRRTVLLSLMMAAGIVGFWLAIGSAIAGLKQFTAVNQLFQYPWFTLGVGLIIAVLGVAMLGAFRLDLPRVVYQINPTGDTAAGSVGFGVMTAVLATPCAGPLMGGAMAWATKQGGATTLLTFAALGGGMALPYVVLTLFPKLVDRLPRAGAGSELLKQTMGILMLAAAAFFVGSGWVGLTADGTAATARGYWWVVGGLIVAAGLWLLVRGVQLEVLRSAKAWAGVGGLAAVLILAGGWVGLEMSRPDATGHEAGDGAIGWVYYTPQRMEEARAAGQAVVLDFTADWCLNCKYLEKTVLESDAVAEALNGPDVTAMKVDITSSRNTAGTALLREMGRVTIPLLVVLDPAGQRVMVRDFYDASQVLAAVDEATR